MNPEQPEQPEDPKIKPIHSKRMVAFGGALLIAIVLLTGVAIIRHGADTVVDSQSSSSEFQNWLKPTSTIKVGNNRYASSCQLLPKTNVESIFGKLSSTTLIQEKYLDASTSADSAEVGCLYNPVLGDGAKIGLQTKQFADANAVKQLSSVLGSFSNSEVQTELDAYKKALTDHPDKTAQKYFDTLQKSYATYQQYSANYDEATLAKANLNDFILPVSDTLTGALNDFAYVGIHGNTVYTLGHTPASKKGKDSVTAYSSDELVAELRRMYQATHTVTTNLDKDQLDQSPAPTILGKTDHYGSTTVLEACAILTADSFAKITGKTQNNPVDRTTAPIDFTTKRYTKQDKKLLLPDNDCTRQKTEKTGEVTSTNTYLSLDMKYGSSTDQAKQWLADAYPMTAQDTQLQTNADWAVAFANTLKPGTYDPIVVFRVGPYIGQIDLYSRASGADDVPATQEQYVAAINALTASLKQNVASVQN